MAKDKKHSIVSEVLIGQLGPRNTGDTEKQAYVIVSNIANLRNELSEEWESKAAMSLEGLLRPVSLEGKGDLPRFATDECTHILPGTEASSPDAQPPITLNSEDKYNLAISQEYLNPLTNPTDTVHGTQDGHDIDILARGTPTDEREHISAVVEELNGMDPYQSDYGFLALRGPLVIQAWGYDTNGKPIPNKADDESDASVGIFKQAHLQDTFMDNWLKKSNTWPVGPLDLRWDRKRRVWTGKPPYKMISGIALGAVSPGATGLAYQDTGSEIWDDQGNRIDFSETSFEFVNRTKQTISDQEKITCYYNIDNGIYWALSSYAVTGTSTTTTTREGSVEQCTGECSWFWLESSRYWAVNSNACAAVTTTTTTADPSTTTTTQDACYDTTTSAPTTTTTTASPECVCARPPRCGQEDGEVYISYCTKLVNDPPVCLIGACCVDETTCVNNMTKEGCEFIGGVFHKGLLCSAVDCATATTTTCECTTTSTTTTLEPPPCETGECEWIGDSIYGGGGWVKISDSCPDTCPCSYPTIEACCNCCTSTNCVTTTTTIVPNICNGHCQYCYVYSHKDETYVYFRIVLVSWNCAAVSNCGCPVPNELYRTTICSEDCPGCFYVGCRRTALTTTTTLDPCAEYCGTTTTISPCLDYCRFVYTSGSWVHEDNPCLTSCPCADPPPFLTPDEGDIHETQCGSEPTTTTTTTEVPRGACCGLPPGGCTSDMTQVDCEAEGGQWLINKRCTACFSSCEDDCVLACDSLEWILLTPCENDEFSCCNCSGSVHVGTACVSEGATTAYPCTGCATTTTSTTTTAAPTGACCPTVDGPICIITTEAGCGAGAWQGAGTDCSPNPCIITCEGTCTYICSGGVKVVLSSTCTTTPSDDCDCVDAGVACSGSGSSTGDCGTTTTTASPTGACCIDGICYEGVLESNCTALSGTWIGAGSDCDPNPCSA